MKEPVHKIAGVIILFFTLIFATKLFLLLKLEIMLILFFIPLILFKNIYKELLSKQSFAFFIDNILLVTWISASIELITISIHIEYSIYKLINITLFIFLSYSFQYIMRKKYISENSLSDQVILDKFKFTVREKELIQYLIKGLKYKEIAGELFISENTVKKHISNIYTKAGVKNKVELIYKILQH